MKIRVSDIPDDGLAVDFQQGIESIGCIARARLVLSRVGTDVIISGDIDSDVPLECGRCLEGFTMGISVPVEVVCASEGSLSDGEVELSEDELVRDFMGEEIDAGQIVAEQILLNVPMVPLCSENCKGLCPDCGTDLNKDACTCSRDRVDPRMQTLRKFFNKGEKE